MVQLIRQVDDGADNYAGAQLSTCTCTIVQTLSFLSLLFGARQINQIVLPGSDILTLYFLFSSKPTFSLSCFLLDFQQDQIFCYL